MHAREGLDVAAKYLGQFAGGRFAVLADRIRQKVQRPLDAQFFTVDVKSQARDGFIKHPLPGVTNHAEIMEEFFQLIGKLIGFHRADAVKDGFVTRQIGVLVQQIVQMVVRQLVQFQREKHQRCGEVGDLFLAIGHEFCPARIGGQLVIPQPGKRHDPPCDLGDLFVAQDTLKQASRVQVGQFTFVIGRKAGASLLQPTQITIKFGSVLACV